MNVGDGFGELFALVLGAEDVMYIHMCRGRWEYRGVLERGSG